MCTSNVTVELVYHYHTTHSTLLWLSAHWWVTLRVGLILEVLDHSWMTLEIPTLQLSCHSQVTRN